MAIRVTISGAANNVRLFNVRCVLAKNKTIDIKILATDQRAAIETARKQYPYMRAFYCQAR